MIDADHLRKHRFLYSVWDSTISGHLARHPRVISKHGIDYTHSRVNNGQEVLILARSGPM